MEKKMNKNCRLTHALSDIYFNIFYDFDADNEEVEITGIYMVGNNQDLIDVISDEVMDDLENDIIYEVEGL